MGAFRPGVITATVTGVALSGIVSAGSLLAAGMLDVGPGAGRPGATDLPAIELPARPDDGDRDRPARTARRSSDLAASSALRAATDTSEVRRRAAARPGRPSPGARRPERERAEDQGAIVPVDAQGETSAPPSPPPATEAPAPGPGATASASRRVTLRVADAAVEPARADAAGRMRLRLEVQEEAAPGATAASAGAAHAPLPGDLDVVVAVPEVPKGKALKVRVDLEHAAAGSAPGAAPNLHVTVAIVDAARRRPDLVVAERAPSSDTASNTLEVVASLDAPVSGVPEVVTGPEEDEEPAAEVAEPVEVRVPVQPADVQDPDTVQVVEVSAPGAPAPEPPAEAGADGAQAPAREDDAASGEDEPEPEPRPEPDAPAEEAPEAPAAAAEEAPAPPADPAV